MELFKSKKGYTLVELLISMVIFAILMIIFSNVTFSAISIATDINLRNKYRESITEVIDLIKRDIRNGESLGTCVESSCTITVTSKVVWEKCADDIAQNAICKFKIDTDGTKSILKRTPDNIFVNKITFESLSDTGSAQNEVTNTTIIVTIEAIPIKNNEDRRKALDGELPYDVRQTIISTRNVNL